MSETVEVTNGDTVEQCDIIDTYSYYGDTVAKVDGETISGFVAL